LGVIILIDGFRHRVPRVSADTEAKESSRQKLRSVAAAKNS
jgi:hypothetical protein